MAKTMEPTVNVNEVSRISTGTKVKGEISSSNDIRIDGTCQMISEADFDRLVGGAAPAKPAAAPAASPAQPASQNNK